MKLIEFDKIIEWNDTDKTVLIARISEHSVSFYRGVIHISLHSCCTCDHPSECNITEESAFELSKICRNSYDPGSLNCISYHRLLIGNFSLSLFKVMTIINLYYDHRKV